MSNCWVPKRERKKKTWGPQHGSQFHRAPVSFWEAVCRPNQGLRRL
jgi:hypothetical protein